jgi:hypothetical protein
MNEIAKRARQEVDLWDNHGRFRDFLGEGEPFEVTLARHYQAAVAACKAALAFGSHGETHEGRSVSYQLECVVAGQEYFD